MDRQKIIDTFKRVYGIEKIGIGNFKNLYKDFGLPSQGWEEISSGVMEGNFDHLYFNGRNYYSFVIDPFYTSEEIIIFETKNRKTYSELVYMTHLFFRIIVLKEEEAEKTCWECGRKFGFFDILGDEETSPKKNFERAISHWEDSHCGCH